MYDFHITHVHIRSTSCMADIHRPDMYGYEILQLYLRNGKISIFHKAL